MTQAQRMAKKYRDNRAAGLRFVQTGEGLKAYSKGREDYRRDLTRLALAAVDSLQALGVGVDLVIK